MSKHFFAGFGAKRKRPIRAEEGFSLVVALLVVLLGLFGTLALAGRTLSSRDKDNENGQGKSARDAAEIGMTRIIAELNRPRNRRLLVNAPQLNTGTATVTSIAGDADLISPCDSVNGAAPDLTTAGTFNPSTTNSGNLLNNEVTIPNTNSTLRYTLVAVTNGTNNNEQAADGSANSSFNVTVGNPGPPGTVGTSGTVTLDVRGLLYQNGVEAGRYNLRKTYAVIPKCCGSSFGGFTGTGTTSAYTASLWGNDSSVCGVSSGYGLILGARRDLTDANTKGSLNTLLTVLLERTVGGTTTNSTVSRTYCTVPVPPGTLAAADCPLNSTAAIVRTQLIRTDIALPAVPYPVGTGTGNYVRTSSIPTLTSFSTTRGTTTYPTSFLNSSSTCTSGTCNVQEYARMRVCDANILSTQWLGATGTGSRSASTATLSSASPVVGCNITVTANETLSTNDFANWKNAAGNTLKWHLGRLCVQVSNWGSSGNTVIYCNLSRLTLSAATITFNTGGSAANTSIPIILSFPNGGTIITSGFLASGGIVQTNTQRSVRLNDLSIYGAAIGQQATPAIQTITSGTLATLNLSDVFVYAPYATMVTNFSILTFRGAYWGNKLTQTLSGSTFTIPAGTVDTVSNAFPSWTPGQLDREVDFVARSVTSVSSF
jgi:hypothetical protein